MTKQRRFFTPELKREAASLVLDQRPGRESVQTDDQVARPVGR